MSFLSSLDKKDRRLLIGVFAAVFVFALIIGIFSTEKSDDKNTTPSTFESGKHGARAAYETLVRTGYTIERWEEPLGGLVEKSGPGTVLVIAEPGVFQIQEVRAIRKILDRGGRVLVTGAQGGKLLPDGASTSSENFTFAACQLKPEGLDALASTGEVWMVPAASWRVGNPSYRVQYTCAGQPAVVEYDSGKGHIVWWASSTPIENSSIGRAKNLDLLLNSIGPVAGQHIYWDESLHGDVRSVWSFSTGLAQTMLWYGLLAIAVLIILSFSRRSGPLRALPVRPRTTPVEYLEALGSLYQKAGAAETALEITWERFRRNILRLCGLKPTRMDAAELAEVIRSRYPQTEATLKADLLAVEEGVQNGVTLPRAALKLAQSLYHHQTQILLMARLQKGSTKASEFRQNRG